MDYKNTEDDIESIHVTLFREPESKNIQQTKSNISKSKFDSFTNLCKAIPLTYENNDVHLLISQLNKLEEFKNDIDNSFFSSFFVENNYISFFAELIRTEIVSKAEDIESYEYFFKPLLILIRDFSFASPIIMNSIKFNEIISDFIVQLELYSIHLRSIIFQIIRNFLSCKQKGNVDSIINIKDLIKICSIELLNENYDHLIIEILVTLIQRVDIIKDNEDIEVIYDLFYQVFNHENVSLYSESLAGLCYLIQTKSGQEVIVNDAINRAEKCVMNAINRVGSNFIKENALQLASFLYSILDGDRLIIFHQKIILKLGIYLVENDEEVQKATLNVISTIIIKHPEFIESLVNNGIYVSPRSGLNFIFQKSSFDLKKTASYIVMGTVLKANNEIRDYLLENKLIISATEIITSDIHFLDENKNMNYQLPSVIDALIILLGNDRFKERLIAQIEEACIDDLIFDFQSINKEIDTKFMRLKEIISQK